MKRKAEIKLNVELNDNNIPEKIGWFATDAGMEKETDTNAFMLSIWDAETKNTLGIDLWTDKMLVEDMKVYFFQTLFKMAQTFENATKDKEAAQRIKKFADEFAEYLNSKNKDREA